jgi:short-subunit dehydrogenase
MQRTALITGCSSGIGRALVGAFLERDFFVVATARRVASLAELAEDKRVLCLPLDVCDAGSISDAVGQVLERRGRVDVLVNNAGFGLMGPALELDAGDLRRQLETHVVGPLALTQAVAPAMIEARAGLIVNVGSVSGVLTTPFAGAYCASKAALHALSDALRMELKPFGIHVVTVQPGGIQSRFGDTAGRILDETLAPDSRYRAVAGHIAARARAGQEGAMDAQAFAREVLDELMHDPPPAIVRAGRSSIKLPLYRWALPTSLLDRVLSKKFGLDRLP